MPRMLSQNTVTMLVSFETLGMYDDRYRRKSRLVSTTEPTKQEWADYKKACKALEYLNESPYFQGGGQDYGPEIEVPEPKRVYEYTETEQEWRARCQDISREKP